MTEDEAKTKACFRAATFGGNQQLAAGPGPNCIASYCMAWRTQTAPRETVRNYADAPTVQPKPGFGGRIYPDGWQYAHTDTDRDGRVFDLLHRIADETAGFGYCGLAGSPS